MITTAGTRSKMFFLTVGRRKGRISSMKTTLDLPDALVNEVEVRARRDGRNLDVAVAELLRKGLDMVERPPASARGPILRTHPESGLPYIECPADAPARRMTMEDLVAMEHEILDRDDGRRIGLSP